MMRFVLSARWMSIAALPLLLLAATSNAQVPATKPAAAPSMKIVLVGDSTVTDKAGWGVGFAELLAADVKCVNLAQGGRSSKSYRNEGWWDKAMAEKGDYVLIQFGHNDQPGKGPERETDAETEFRANMKRYVDEARAAGAKPILVTSLTRRNFNPDGKIRRSLDAYVKVTKEVAADTKTPLIDLHDRSLALAEKLGRQGCEPLSPRDKEGKIDTTRLNAEGSRAFGALVADDLALVVPELAAHIKTPSK